jgi:CBS domain-containing protein
MSKVRDILQLKGTQILAMHPDASVLDAAILMNDHKVGSVVVSDHGQLAGIFTERDILRRVVAQQYPPATTKLYDVMTTDVVCCELDTPLDTARKVMMHRRVRHLPVLDERQQLAGIISIGDLNAYRLEGQEVQIHMLKEYLYGRV